MATSTTTLRCWEIRAGIPTGDGRMADCSTPEVIGDERYHPTEVDAEQRADELRESLADTGLDTRTVYHVAEVTLHDADAYDVARRWTEAQRNAAGWMRCQSGEWSGVRCESIERMADVGSLVSVRWVPECNRETATKAGTWRGLSRTSRVCAWCAEHMQDVDADWVREVRS